MTTNGSNKNETESTIERFIQRLEKHQEGLGLSDNAFVARYQKWLRSTKTWRHRLRARDYKDLNVDKWEKQLSELVSKLDGGSVTPIEFFAELPFAKQLDAIVTMVRSQGTDRRNVYALATTGVGKSIFAQHFTREHPQDSAYTRMNEQCRNRPGQIIFRIAQAIGLKRELSDARLLHSVIDRLQADPITIFIDEAHSGGHKLMQIVKTLVDETPARFVQLAYPTEFDRVKSATAGALDEAKQLIGRTIKPIFDNYREGLHAPDIQQFLVCSGLDQEAALDVADVILPMVRANGNLRVLADAVESARMLCLETDKELDGATVRRAVESQCPRR
jgi:DNA transposition AAA+ family ATPase